MKKMLIVLIIILSIILLISGCQNKYKVGVSLPDEYPDELEIYEDAVVFEAVVEEEEIVIKYGTEDDIDDVIEFLNELTESLEIICTEKDEGRNDYTAEGIGSCYEFQIAAEKAEDKEEKYFDTVVTVEVEFNDESIELMDDLQGNWMYWGLNGEIFSQLNRNGIYYEIDGNSYKYYEGFKSELAETYVFFMEDNFIQTKSQAGVTEAYKITFEEIDGTDFMTMESDEYAPQHFIEIKNDELEEYKKINETWNKMKGFWQRIGANGEIDDEYRCFAYDFSDYTFDVYVDLEATSAGVLYEYMDEDTIEYEFAGEMDKADIVFETIDGVEVMTFEYEDAKMHFEKTTLEDYKENAAGILSAETLESIQGLWYLVGKDGKITDIQKDLGFAYEFYGNQFDTYNDFELTNTGMEFYFVDENSFEYVTSTGSVISVDIVFEQVGGLDVMTYLVNTAQYHLIKVTHEEFEAYNGQSISLTMEQLQGFWRLAGSNGQIGNDSADTDFAYKFTVTTFTSFSNYQVGSKDVAFSMIDNKTLSFMGGDGVSYMAGIAFENIDGTDVMTYTFNAVDYHFVKTTYEEYMQDAVLSQIVFGFWVMIGSQGHISEEIWEEGNAIEFSEELMTTYAGYEVSIQTSDFKIQGNTVIYDYGIGELTAEIEFKTVDGEEVLCAIILSEEY